ncbi:VWA domain-containing protein [Schlesneria sp. DSM 10557]|uniref:VWA domain-containing protein n=1 Tax=Schlesneria sp. DSM 10557 TaxID=3044399 RepID=UPI00359FB843
MNWQHPEALYLILPLCVGWLVLALESQRRRRRAREAFAAQAMWERILPEELRLRFFTKLLLREGAMICGLVALAGPRFGTEVEQVVPRGSDIYVLIDISRSMLADDVVPSRLGRAKADVASLLNRLEGERVGLIAFAGQAVVKCPLTVDYDSFRRSLDELDPDSAPRGGTAIGDAIRKGLEVFSANAERDQTMILITDGDDQKSYPLEAAAAANERRVSIFTIGLGDAERGARVPLKGDAQGYLEYQGQQVWSKLDGDLLEQIALKTAGIYVPAGTRSYDLGELYEAHLRGRRGAEEASQKKIRYSEKFQTFLAMSLLLLLVDLGISVYRKPAGLPQKALSLPGNPSRERRRGATASSLIALFAVLPWAPGPSNVANAIEPAASLKEGLQLYSSEKYDEALTRFTEAKEELDQRKSADAAVAAFDEACAAHRKGDFEVAREAYLRAGLSLDRRIATSAHYNLGNLSAEKARTLAGEKPELVAPKDRQEILDQLSHAVAAYRHCLELQSDHPSARRNLELVRRWIKYYSDRWNEIDRQKRRDESNLLTFLNYIVEDQTTLKNSVQGLQEPVRSNTFAELKRAQELLKEEIPTLREKIDSELRSPPDPQSGNTSAPSKELEDGIKLLQSWADTAAEKMGSAARQLSGKDREKAVIDQQAALDELDRIWEGVIPFKPLLSEDIVQQKQITAALAADLPEETDSEEPPASAESDSLPLVNDTASTGEAQDQNPNPSNRLPQTLAGTETSAEELSRVVARQLKTLKRTQLLVPKAEAELDELEAPRDDSQQDDAAGAAMQKVDPEDAKKGLRVAIARTPDAVKQMEEAIQSLRQNDRRAAARQAEEALRILEEIEREQPKDDQQQDQDQKDQEQQNQQDDEKQDQQQDNNQKESSEEEQNKKDESQNKDQDESKERRPDPVQASNDRLEDALRKVRERQQEKRDRDRKLKGQFLGRVPVDKDW